ncbi:transposase [Pseudoxanthomonas yeongjuensis]|uniref:REP-associated tyrosine transposase n=1 Tax=Pseudoxanthomonas yeongjuensis TaxID=377616 RepID=UPI001391FDD0|nr:transposase [Pseudoxanthomonas yeongjuensis]KAF1716843.1 transposase [Pseudoxanthomonas yeongjuensis]
MRTYVRARVTGGTYFFTVNLAERHGNTLLVDRIDVLKRALQQTRQDHPFAMPGFVVLPEHLHCLWRMPTGDDDFPMRWRLIKSRFSRSLSAGERRTHSRANKNERGIWQRRYWEHLVRDDADFQRCLDYIHYNPVKHGRAVHAMDWPHSSFLHWVERGVYPPDWATPVDIGPDQSE